MLRDSLLQRKASWESVKTGANASADATVRPAHLLPGCRLVEETKGGADRVQVSCGNLKDY